MKYLTKGKVVVFYLHLRVQILLLLEWTLEEMEKHNKIIHTYIFTTLANSFSDISDHIYTFHQYGNISQNFDVLTLNLRSTISLDWFMYFYCAV